MNQYRWTILPLVAVLVMVINLPARAEVLEKTKNIAGTTVRYKVVLPNNFDPNKAYPAVLRVRRRTANREHRRQRH